MNMQIDYETERELGIDYETLFYGYPDAGNKRNPGNQGNSEI